MFCILSSAFQWTGLELQSANEEDGDAGLPCATACTHRLRCVSLEEIQTQRNCMILLWSEPLLAQQRLREEFNRNALG